MAILLLGLTAPTHVVNAITAAIYKKYILLSLLLHGASCGSHDALLCCRRLQWLAVECRMIGTL